MTKLVIVDDHEALREGLAVLLGGHGMDVVGAAGNCAAGLDLVNHVEPDVALIDIRLPDAAASTSRASSSSAGRRSASSSTPATATPTCSTAAWTPAPGAMR